jgi:hypothetical protein
VTGKEATYFTDEYLEYIKSPEWRRKRRTLIRQRGRVCERCGQRSKAIEVHHLTYERLGNERDEDLQLVCPECHPMADLMRKREMTDPLNACYAWRMRAWNYYFSKYGLVLEHLSPMDTRLHLKDYHEHVDPCPYPEYIHGVAERGWEDGDYEKWKDYIDTGLMA